MYNKEFPNATFRVVASHSGWEGEVYRLLRGKKSALMAGFFTAFPRQQMFNSNVAGLVVCHRYLGRIAVNNYNVAAVDPVRLSTFVFAYCRL
jgi:hypothetical protein